MSGTKDMAQKLESTTGGYCSSW